MILARSRVKVLGEDYNVCCLHLQQMMLGVSEVRSSFGTVSVLRSAETHLEWIIVC